MATADELRAQQAAMQAAEEARVGLGMAPGETEVTPETVAPLDDPFEGVDPVGDPFESYASRYPVDQTLTPQYMAALNEKGGIFGTRPPLPEGETKYPEHPSQFPEGTGGVMDPTALDLLRGEVGMGADLRQTAMNMMTPDPMEIADMLVEEYPDKLDVRLSPEGEPVLRNIESGFETAINVPGLSRTDMMQAVGLIGAFTPASRFAMAPREAMRVAGKGMSRLKRGAARPTKTTRLTGQARADAMKRANMQAGVRGFIGSGLTEAGIQAAQEHYGGDFTSEDIALSATLGLLPEVLADPLINSAFKAGEIISRRGKIIPQSIQKALDFADRNGLRIMTSDALSETLTPARRIFLKAAERVPVMGTGKMRVKQKAQRADVLENIVNEAGVDPMTDYGQLVVNGFARQQTRILGDKSRNLLGEVGKKRQAAVDTLVPHGQMPPSRTMAFINEQRVVADGLEPDMAKAMHAYLDRIEGNITQRTKFDFEDAINLRNSLYQDADMGLYNTGPKGNLQGEIGDVLLKDMDEFAKQHGAYADWSMSQSMWREGLKKVKNQTLKKAIETGRFDRGVVEEVFSNGTRSDMRALYSRLDANGQVSARRYIMGHIFHRAGGTVDNLANATPKRFVDILEKDKQIQRALKEFFPGELDMLEGAKEFLKITAAADDIGKGVGMTAAMAGGALVTGLLDAFVGAAAATAVLGRVHEGKAIRGLLLALNHAKGNPDVVTTIMSELRPLVMQSARLYVDDGRNPFAPKEQPDLLERIQRAGGKQITDVIDAAMNIRIPGLSPQAKFDDLTGTGGGNPAERLRQLQMQMNAPGEDTQP